MPGRTSARSARPSNTSDLTTKSSVPSFSSRSSTAPRISTTLISAPDDGPVTDLRLEICSTFSDCQKSTSAHRKLVVRLRKIQEACCYVVADPKGRKTIFAKHFGEGDFNSELGRCVLRILGVKKTESAGDRTVRFLVLFLKSASEKDLAIFAEGTHLEDTQTVPETPTSRLTFNLLSLLIPLLSAKERTVRFRATQIVSHVVNTLDSIDDELYHLIRQGLTKRIRDKESSIRIQAVMGLGRLAGNEAEEDQDDEDGDDMDSSGLLEKLLDVLQNDASAEVRRALLLNLPLTPTTLPYLLERARDLDSPTRRALYSRLLPTLGDFRHLSLSMREKLLRWGLRDRDETVRKAAARLFRERWIEDCAGTHGQCEENKLANTLSTPSISGLLELLERIDVINSGVNTGIALEAMMDFWEGRPDYLHVVVFDDAFWDALTPESVFMARSFNDFCQQRPTFQALCDDKMPEVTRLGFYLQKNINTLLDSIKSAAENGGGDEETAEQEFIVEQLLQIAQTLDFSDEVGRRKMFSLLREALAMADLPEEATRLTVEVLRLVCGADAAGEREFCGVILEAIAEVHDNIVSSDIEEDGEESFVSARSEASDSSNTPARSKKGRSTPSESSATAEEQEQKVIQEIMVNMKCLYIAQCMLQNIDGNLQQNLHLVTMLNNLVVPAVRSHEAPIRERGLVCLGLCCILDRTLAEENTILFIHCFTKGHEALQITSLQILCDIFTAHPTLLSSSTKDESSTPIPPFQKPLLKCFTRALRHTSPAGVQSTAAVSLSKLLLTSRLPIPDASLDSLLLSLVLCFFDSRTADNPNLRQALAYFLPVYAHSRLENCERMARVAVSVVSETFKMADELFTVEAEEDSDGDVDESAAEKKVRGLMVTVLGMVGDWTDERKVVVLDSLTTSVSESEQQQGLNGCGGVQLRLAGDVLERVLTPGCYGQEKKFLLSLLGKLYIPTPPSSSSTTSLTAPTAQQHDPTSRESVAVVMFELASHVKALLDEAIADGVATDAAGRNTLVKIKNAVLKLVQGRTVGAGISSRRKSHNAKGMNALVAQSAEDRSAMMAQQHEDEEDESDDEDEDDAGGEAVPVQEEEEEEDDDDEGEGEGEGEGTMTMTTRTVTRMMENVDIEVEEDGSDEDDGAGGEADASGRHGPARSGDYDEYNEDSDDEDIL